jgi:hypothetical protein
MFLKTTLLPWTAYSSSISKNSLQQLKQTCKSVTRFSSSPPWDKNRGSAQIHGIHLLKQLHYIFDKDMIISIFIQLICIGT